MLITSANIGHLDIFFCEVPFQVFWPFLIMFSGVFFLLMYIFLIDLDIVLCQLHVLQILSSTVWFAPLLESLNKKKFLILVKSNLSIFSYMVNAFFSYRRYSKDIFLSYFLEVIALIFVFKSTIHLELIFEYV